MNTPISALILAAGRGSRMNSLTQDLPKCLVQVDSRSILDIQLSILKKFPFQEISAVGGYLHQKLEPYFDQMYLNEKWSETNMVYSLLQADELLSKSDTIVLYSDIIYQSELVQLLMKSKAQNLVLPNLVHWNDIWSLRFENPLDDAETFKRNNSGELIEIGKKPKSKDEIQGQFMGIMKWSPESWSKLKSFLNSLPQEKVRKMDCTTMLNSMILEGIKIEVLDYQGLWFEVDSDSDRQALLNSQLLGKFI